MAKKKGPQADDLDEYLENVKEDVKDIGLGIKMDLIDKLRGATAEAKLLANITANDLLQAMNDVAKAVSTIASNQEKLEDRTLKSKDVAKQMAALKREELKAVAEVKKAVEKRFLTEQAGRDLQADIVDKANALTSALNYQYHLALKQEKINKSNEKYHERLEKSFNYLAKIPILGGMISVSKIMDKVKKTAEEGGNKWKQFGAGLGELFKQLSDPFTLITTGITGAISLFTTLFKWALAFDQKVYDAAKNIGVSVGEAERLHGQFQAIAASGMNLGLQAKDIVKTFSEMNEQMGFMVPSSADFAGNMTLIQKRIGASAADMEAIATSMAFSGKSAKATYGILIGTAKVEAARNGFMMTNRQILNAIATTSKTVLMNFGGNVKELVKSIVAAKKLGTTLDEIQNKGNTVLDFESSISKEFEFQAMTGRNIDLQGARQAAQAHDMVALTKELTKNQSSYVQWMSMGTIERQTEAELYGTSVEELNKIYTQQRLITALGKQEGESLAHRYGVLMKTAAGRERIAKSLSQEEQADLARASANEEWEATLERIKDLLGSILRGPVVEIVHTVTAWLNNTKLVQEFGMKVKGVFQGVADIVKKIPEFLQKLPGYIQQAIPYIKALASIAAVLAAANVAAAIGLGGPFAAVGALAAGMFVYNKLTSLLGEGGGGGGDLTGGAPAARGIAPMNQPAAAAAQNQIPYAPGQAPNQVIQNNTTVQIGGRAVGQASTEATIQSGYNMDGNTGKSNGKGSTVLPQFG